MNRDEFNLIHHKLQLYLKWKGVRDHLRRLSAPESQRSRRAERLTRKYSSQIVTYFRRTALSYDGENEDIQAAINGLPPVTRGVYVLRTGLGKGFAFSDREIAILLKVSERTVPSLFDHAATVVAPLIEEQADEAGVTQFVVAEDLLEQARELSPYLIKHLKEHSSDLRRVHWKIFEQLVGEFFASWGYQVLHVAKESWTSADLIAIRPSDASGAEIRYYIEVKRWKNRVGVEVIDRVLGAIAAERPQVGFHLGMIVSIGGFKEVKKYTVRHLRHLGLELRGLPDVENWLDGYTFHPSGLWLRTATPLSLP